MSNDETDETGQVPPGVGDVYGPRYPGNAAYGDMRRVPTNYGFVTIDKETIRRFWNDSMQEVVGGHWEADCPKCYTTHTVSDVTDDGRARLIETLLECCAEVQWLPPSDYLDPCPVCGRSHRERHECTAPALREPFPDLDRPAECTDCGWTADRAENIPTHDGRCPECESRAVQIGDGHADASGGDPRA